MNDTIERRAAYAFFDAGGWGRVPFGAVATLDVGVCTELLRILIERNTHANGISKRGRAWQKRLAMLQKSREPRKLIARWRVEMLRGEAKYFAPRLP